MNHVIRFVVAVSIMFIFYVLFGLFDSTPLPHWKFWSYEIVAENGSESCSVKITPVFLDLIRVDYDSVEFDYSSAIVTFSYLGGSESKHIVTCGNDLYIESHVFKGEEEGSFEFRYKNNSYYTSKSISSFLHSYHDLYFGCKENSIKTNLNSIVAGHSDFTLYCSGYKYLIHK